MRFIYLLLFLSPLPFASARPIWQYTWVIFIGLSGLIYALRWKSLNTAKLPKAFYFPVGAMALLIIWGALQASLGWSVTPQHTISTTLFFFSHLVWFFLVFKSFKRQADAPKFVLMIGLIVTAYCIYGLIIYFTGNETILWYEKVIKDKSLSSTFGNRNNFATFVGIAFQCMLAYALWSYYHKNTENVLLHTAIIQFLTRSFNRVGIIILSIMILFSALLLTASRAGITASIVGSAFLLIASVLANWYNKTEVIYKLKTTLIFVLSILIFVMLFNLSGETYQWRMGYISESNTRLLIFPLILEAIKEVSILGYGLGTFSEVFAELRVTSLPKPIARAHSDILELFLTSGLILGFCLMVSLLFLSITFLLRAFKSSDDKIPFLLTVSIFIQVGLHSLVDFSLQMPAVSYLCISLLAMGAFVMSGKQQKKNPNYQALNS